jgi:D-sedoheptulose 7-phosphate isomerase
MATINQYLDDIKFICDSLDKTQIQKFIDTIKNISSKGRLFIVGVGGSAANASHAVNDFRKILSIETYTPTDNVSELTARINDESWEDAYKNWLKISKLCKEDILIILSVGGGSIKTSYNLVKSIQYAWEQGCKILSIVSRDGGYSLPNSHACIKIPCIDDDTITPHAEEWQGIILHMVVHILSQTK